uniref:Uncharacterized protein n=2 Tax=Oryza glumipatula TaxID=40148 RepID=A0A0E0BJQ4_9ORYZ
MVRPEAPPRQGHRWNASSRFCSVVRDVFFFASHLSLLWRSWGAHHLFDGMATRCNGGRGAMDFIGMFKDLKQTVANGLVAVRPPSVEEQTDAKFVMHKAKLEDFEQHLMTASQQENNMNEIIRFNKQKRHGLVEMLKGFARNQCAMAGTHGNTSVLPGHWQPAIPICRSTTYPDREDLSAVEGCHHLYTHLKHTHTVGYAATIEGCLRLFLGGWPHFKSV